MGRLDPNDWFRRLLQNSTGQWQLLEKTTPSGIVVESAGRPRGDRDLLWLSDDDTGVNPKHIVEPPEPVTTGKGESIGLMSHGRGRTDSATPPMWSSSSCGTELSGACTEPGLASSANLAPRESGRGGGCREPSGTLRCRS